MTISYKYLHNKNMRKSLGAVLILALFALLTGSVSAREKSVLGLSTSSSLQIPPTPEGPGLILPDSPLFFLDNLKQNTRLFLAFTPEAKSKIYTDIAGERMAELRFMLIKNNPNGIKITLSGVSDNLQNASSELSMAKLSGKDVSVLAKSLNENIKRKQQGLDILDDQVSQSEFKTRIKATLQGVEEAKAEAEDSLPEDELENELRDNLNRKIARQVNEASDSAQQLRLDLIELEKQATESSKKSLRRREEALKLAIEAKNEALLKVEQRLLENEKKKQEKLLEVQSKVAVQAREAIEKAKEAALKFNAAINEIERIRTQSVSTASSR